MGHIEIHMDYTTMRAPDYVTLHCTMSVGSVLSIYHTIKSIVLCHTTAQLLLHYDEVSEKKLYKGKYNIKRYEEPTETWEENAWLLTNSLPFFFISFHYTDENINCGNTSVGLQHVIRVTWLRK